MLCKIDTKRKHICGKIVGKNADKLECKLDVGYKE